MGGRGAGAGKDENGQQNAQRSEDFDDTAANQVDGTDE